jgi:DNA-binding CsgD family transcriptional regulator
VTVATDWRRVDALARRCYVGLGAAALRDETLRGLRSIVPVDAAFFATVDPATILFTSMMAEDPLAKAQALFLDNEYGHADVNKFTTLAMAVDPVGSLDSATAGHRRDSVRYAEVMAPLDLGDELRAALVAHGRCWGVICLHRADGPGAFSPHELALVRRLVPHLAEGLRRALVTAEMATAQPTIRGPGVVVLDEDMAITSANLEAEQWLTDLVEPGWDPGAGSLPATIRAVAARALRTADDAPTTVTRLRTRHGTWLTVHASRLLGPLGLQTAIILESARPMEMASLYLDAHGLTPAQSRVAALVLQGHSTRQIVNELHISSHTLQEHLRAVFDKFGISSRRELVAALLASPR